MSNEVSFCFSKTFVIHRCLRSKSSFFDKREMTYYTLQCQRINKHVLDLALTLIYGFYRVVSTWQPRPRLFIFIFLICSAFLHEKTGTR
jgi:hypothetical protein